MLKNKLMLSSIIVGLAITPVWAAASSQSLEFPKPPAYRVGISELPENQYIQAEQQKTKLEKKYAKLDETQDAGIADMTYADLSIKRLSKEVSQELEYEEQEMLADLSLLWQGAAIQSDTINFALYKLANPDADKPDEKSVKKVLTTIASMSTLVGASMGSPVLAGSSLIGGNILGIMSQDTKALNYKYTRVTDADMIILIRKVEDLQQRAVDLYYDYMSAKKQLEFANDLVKERQRKFELAQKNNAQRELIVITDAYYRTALDKQRTAKSEFFSKRAALEQFVGNETFVQFEHELTARENGETTKPSTPAKVESEAASEPAAVEKQQDKEYSNTVQNVENYTKGLSEAQQEVSAVQTPQVQEASVDQTSDEYSVKMNSHSLYDDGSLTGLSANIDEEAANDESAQEISKSKKGIFGRFKKDKKDKKNEEEKTKKETNKYPKNSTKGLIFLHGQDKHSVKSNMNNNNTVKEKGVSNSYSEAKNIIPKVDDSGFLPLDEIRVPDLTRGGYSIHSDYSGDINNASLSVPD